MKRLKYVILLLFVFSVFSSIFAQGNQDYDLWYKEHEWLMLKQEKSEWQSLKTEQKREEFIAKFYTARDPDTFTYRNEFQLVYQANLEKVRQDYPNFNDPRRYIYLLFGKPTLKRFFTEQVVPISFSLINIWIGRGEIWSYDFSGQRFQIIFAQASSSQLQLIRDRNAQESEDIQSLFSICSAQYEIFYFGSEKYIDISSFLQNFFQENFRIKSTPDIIDDLKKRILDSAERFYEKPKPKVLENKYSKEWKSGIQILIDQFDINSSQEGGIAIWILFDKDSLNYNSKKDKYSANISLYCEIRDANDHPVVYYCDDNINYKIKTSKAYYHFWGSLPAGKYKLILELGDNIGKKYKRVEQDIAIFDFSMPGLKASLLIGKIAEDPEIVKGKPGYWFFKEGKFYPAFSGEYFRDDDEMIVALDVSGFQKNLYGNPYLEMAILFVRGDIKQGKFVSSQKVFTYGFLPIEKDGDRFQGIVRLKIKNLVAELKLSLGYYYQIQLWIEDKIANEGGTKDYYYPILILSKGTD